MVGKSHFPDSERRRRGIRGECEAKRSTLRLDHSKKAAKP
jgi:hypothetical protein